MRPFGKANPAPRLTVQVAIVVLVCALMPLCHLQANQRAARDRSVRSFVLRASFAVADFDGDSQPDLATVELERGAATGDVRYSIRFQLAAGARGSFRVTAPAGGLQIVAKDVNGDNALDLLVSTAWQHKQVAVFLNDGHGNFAPALPEAFPAPLADSEYQAKFESVPQDGSAALLRCHNSAPGEAGQSRRSTQPAQDGGLVEPAVLPQPALLFFSSGPGRAPPTTVR